MADDLVYAVNTDGDTVQIPKAQSGKALSQGFTAASPDQIAAFKRERKYGTAAGQAKAFGAGVARGATFGTSDALLAATGAADPHTLSSLQEVNPKTSVAGEVTGVVGSALLAPEESAVGGISKAGRAVEGAAARLLPKGEGLAARLVSKAGSKAAGSAVEGAAYGLGHVVSEQALGDPNLTAQSAISEIGLSALLGGGLGGLTGVAEEGIPAALNAAKTATGKVRDLAAGTISKISPEAADLVANRASLLADGKPESKALFDALEEQHAASKAVGKQFNSEIRPLESEQFLTEVTPVKAQEAFHGAKANVQELAQKMRAAPEIFPASFAKKVENWGAQLDKVGDDALGGYKALDKVNREIYSVLEKSRKDQSVLIADARDALDGLHKDIKGTLENAEVYGQAGARHAAINNAYSDLLPAEKEFRKRFMVKVGKDFKIDQGKVDSFVNGIDSPSKAKAAEALDAYQTRLQSFHDQVGTSAANAGTTDFDGGALNDLVNKTSDQVAKAKKQAALQALMGDGQPHGLTGLIQQGLQKVPVVGPAMAKGVEAIGSVPGAVKTLAQLERMAQSVDKHIDTAVSTLVRGGVKASYVGRGEAAAGLAKAFGNSPDAQERQYNARIKQVQMLGNDPDHLVGKLNDATAGIQGHAPNTAAAVQMTGSRAAQFLASKVPNHQQGGILAQEWKPSPAEIAKFNRYYEAVQNPTGILKQAAAGTLTPEAVEAVQAVYPELYAHMQQKTLEKLAGGGTVPYQSRMALTMLLGTDVDGSTNPHMIQANTQVYMGAGQAKQQGISAPKPMGVGRAKALSTHAPRLLTAMQRSSQR